MTYQVLDMEQMSYLDQDSDRTRTRITIQNALNVQESNRWRLVEIVQSSNDDVDPLFIFHKDE